MSPLTPEQKCAIKFGLNYPYSILALDPGMGKSRVGIEIQNRTEHKKCLVICPSYLIPNWKQEIEKWMPDKTVWPIFKGKDLLKTMGKDFDFIIISYEIVRKAEALMAWADYVLIDEAHNYKTMGAKRTEFIHRTIYENSIKRLHLLTGTPLKNRVAEFYSLIAMTSYNPRTPDDPFLKKFPDYITFADYFSFRHDIQMEVGGRRFTVTKWEGLRRVDELKKWLKGKYLRLRADKTKSPVLFKDVMISDIEDSALLEAFEVFFKRAGVDSVMPTEKAEAAFKKVDFTIKYAEGLLEETGGPILIYSDHVLPTEKIAQAFGVAPITGKMSGPKRAQMVSEFQAGGVKVLVATIGSLSTGVTLTASNQLIFNDYPWVPEDYNQTVHRIDRLGQSRVCAVHNILGSPQDLHIREVLRDKQKIIDAAT